MNLRKQKNLAARALGVSKKRIKFSLTPENKKELKELISREGVKNLIEDKIIIKLDKKGNSRTRANKILEQKKKGRRSGHGSRKGTANARVGGHKSVWVAKIRALRVLIKSFKDAGKFETKDYRDLYRKAKGNFFRNKRHMMLYIEQNNLLKEETQVKKPKSGGNK